MLENPAEEFPDYVLQRVVPVEEAPDQAEMVEITFEKGDAVAINGERLSPATILTRLNEPGRQAWRGCAGPGGEPLRRDEVAGGLRDARRNDPSGSAPGDRADHAGCGGRPSEGQHHAALCGA